MSLVRAFSTSGLTKPKSVTLALFVHRLMLMKIIIMTKLFSANLAVLLVPDGQPLLNRDGELDITY